MKNLLRVIAFLIISLSLGACGPSAITTLSPVPSPTTTVTATFTSVPDQTSTATLESATSTYAPPIQPTLIPTIDPTLMSGLLSKAFSVQTIEGVNGHNLRQITGWDHGFGGGRWEGSCSQYYWLDASHLLLYPTAGQVRAFDEWGGTGVVPQPVVINLETEQIWLPPANESASPLTCNRVYWSPELGILITSEIHNNISTVSTYTYDGQQLSQYQGGLWDVSPSGRKILIEEDKLIDLRTDEKITLAWSLENYQEQILSDLFWASDETRIYRCCYFYADLTTGASHRFERSDFQDTNGNHLDPSGLWFYRGQWVRNDTYFLVEWSYIDDGDIRYLPMFDPQKKIIYDVREMAGIPEDFTSIHTPVSPDGNYVWIEGWNESYLVNLTTFASQHYTYSNPYSYTDIDWSSDSKFTWFEIYDPNTKSTEFKILSVSDMKLNALPVIPQAETEHWWHPTDNTVVYPDKDGNSLIFLDTSAMSYQELPFPHQGQPYAYGDVAWSPSGEKLALVKEDGSVWQVNYPTLENLEQLTPSLPDISDLNWSPDENSLSFVSGSDIYIVETNK